MPLLFPFPVLKPSGSFGKPPMPKTTALLQERVEDWTHYPFSVTEGPSIGYSDLFQAISARIGPSQKCCQAPFRSKLITINEIRFAY